MFGIKPTTKGFTLLELIVVITVLLLLAALIIPITSKFRQNALTARCAVNIRIYGTAVLLFNTDNGGFPEWDGLPAADSDSTPQFNKWLTEGDYLPTSPRIRCPLADGEQYDNVPHRYRFPYSVNIKICQYYPRLSVGFPAPASRVVLAAEVNDWDGFTSRTSLNNAIWLGGTPGNEGAPRPNRMPIPRYHGTPEQRGLHFFFMDGSVGLVYPTDNDWSKAPVCAPITGTATTGYFYHGTHYANMKEGKLTGQ